MGMGNVRSSAPAHSRYFISIGAVLFVLACDSGDPAGTPTGPDDDPVIEDPLPDTVGLGAAGLLHDSLSLSRFVAGMDTLSSFGDRSGASDSYRAAEAWAIRRLESYGYVVDRHEYTWRSGSRANLYVTKVGTLFPDEVLLVSAHLDGRGGGGATDDDASGVSLVLEVARLLAPENVSTEKSVRFILWNNEEDGLVGSSAYVRDRADLQGVETPVGSGLYPEPNWIGILQHDMILFDHGIPAGPSQTAQADIQVTYQRASTQVDAARELALSFFDFNLSVGREYPVVVGDGMQGTDSWAFRDHTAALGIQENSAAAIATLGANPHWHQSSDVMETYGEADFRMGLHTAKLTLRAVVEIVGVRVWPRE